MEKRITMSNATALNQKNTCNFVIINEFKNNSFVKLLVLALIFLPSFLTTFSSGKNWGNGLYAQIPNAVFDANDAHKGILIPRVQRILLRFIPQVFHYFFIIPQRLVYRQII